MFLYSEPDGDFVRSAVRDNHGASFSYTEVGATREFDKSALPHSYAVDHNRQLLGRGAETYSRAVKALNSWLMFDTTLTRIAQPDTAIKTANIVAVIGYHFLFHSLNLCRIVYTIDDADANTTRYGFAYGTLDEHLESGEERFMIEWTRTDDLVYYDLLAFSRPNNPLVNLGYPFARMMQKRFAVESKAAMKRAVVS